MRYSPVRIDKGAGQPAPDIFPADAVAPSWPNDERGGPAGRRAVDLLLLVLGLAALAAIWLVMGNPFADDHDY
jgi:hypothetical protein